MLVLCLCWAMQQIAIKLVAQDVAPLLQIGLRSAFAAVMLGLVLLRAEGPRFWRDGSARAGLRVAWLDAPPDLLTRLRRPGRAGLAGGPAGGPGRRHSPAPATARTPPAAPAIRRR